MSGVVFTDGGIPEELWEWSRRRCVRFVGVVGSVGLPDMAKSTSHRA